VISAHQSAAYTVAETLVLMANLSKANPEFVVWTQRNNGKAFAGTRSGSVSQRSICFQYTLFPNGGGMKCERFRW
jgi:hypothetical protein